MNRVSSRKSSGFTIVELLVVIVVIGILAAITIVAYTGISQKAVASALQSDLANASTRLKMFQVENSAYPTANKCPTPGVTEICLKFSPGNTFVGYSVNNQSNPQTFLLIVSNSSLAYKITNNSAPTQLASTIQPGVTPGAILELHAAKANNGTGPGINSPLTTTWKDTSGNGNNGTLTNFGGETPWAGAGTPSDPHRLVFDGVNDFVNLPALHACDDDVFSYEAWFTYLGAPPLQSALISEEGAGNLPEASLQIQDSGRMVAETRGYTWDGADSVTVVSPALTIGQLYHGLFISDGSLMRLYLNGVVSGSAVPRTGLVTTRTRLGTLWGGYTYLATNIVVARIYPFALTPEQVATNYAADPDW